MILISSVQALATLSVLSLATLAPVASESFGLGAHFVGYQVSIIYVSAAGISLISGTLVRRWGAVGVSQCALILCTVGILGLSAGNLAILVLGSLFIGAGYGLTNPAASHLLFRLTPPKHRNLFFSLKQTSVPLGGILAGLMLPPLTALAGWRFALLACAGLACTVVCMLNFYRTRLDFDREPKKALKKKVKYDLKMIYRRKSLLRLSIMAFCYSATQLSLMSFAVSMLVEDLMKTLVIAGTVVSLMQGFGAFGRIAWGIVADRMASGLSVLMAIGCISIASSLLMTQMGKEWPLLAILSLLCLFGLCSIGWNGVFLAEVARMSKPEEVSSMTGMALFFTFSGVVVGPTLFSLAYNILGSYTSTFGVIAVFPAAGTFSLLGLRKRKPVGA